MGSIRAQIVLILTLSLPIFSFEKLNETYCITYGDPSAPVEVVEYISFSCPKCLDLFQKDFEKIKKEYIETGKVYWIYHPDPIDLSTLESMVCLEKLNNEQKRLFFESLFEALRPKTLAKAPVLMKKAMEFFDLPIKKLDEIEFLETTTAFQAAFEFLKQNPPIDAVPTVEIAGEIYDEMPTYELIKTQIEKKLKDIQ